MAAPVERRTVETATAGGLMTPAEVAKLFRVDPKTVTRWAQSGKLSSLRTLGGHRRYRRDEVERLLRANLQAESV
ncbi:BldC family transcriptional regulator [Brachybacterium hainanense]|uniref:BldC family transcriptional regulator n=1 Tax=Brachybacterium hainanense TaxID=1541174 RepID=A0ABV6RFT3_9MICO